MNADDWMKIGIGVVIGLFIGYFFLWGETYSDLNQKYNKLQIEYLELNNSYIKLQEDHIKLQSEFNLLRKDVKQLLGEYVAKETLWEISGLEKYRRVIEILGIIITNR